MMLKACLARGDTIEQIRKYGARGNYVHDIESLWRAFKARQATLPEAEFDAIIEGRQTSVDTRDRKSPVAG
jgi:hypothetical protein